MTDRRSFFRTAGATVVGAAAVARAAAEAVTGGNRKAVARR